MQAQRVNNTKTRSTEPLDPIRSLVNGMHDDEILRIYRRAQNPDRLERVAEWFSDTAGDTEIIREMFGCGRYTVRVMSRRKNGQLVIRSSKNIEVTRWAAQVAS